MNRCVRCVAVASVAWAVGVWCAAAADPKDPPKFTLSDEEQKVLDLTNEERKKENLPPLEPAPLLFKAARAHSANMARKGEMNHVLDGKKPSQRVREAGYNYAWMAENIGWGAGPDYGPAGIVRRWMNSKTHRENILSKKFTQIGIGAVRNDKGAVYYTQDFAAPRAKR